MAGTEARSAMVVSKTGCQELYVLNSDTMELEILPREVIIARFNSGQYAYRGSKRTIDELQGEVPVPEDEKEGERDDDVK